MTLPFFKASLRVPILLVKAFLGVPVLFEAFLAFCYRQHALGRVLGLSGTDIFIRHVH